MVGLHFPITGDNRSFIRSLHEVTVGVNYAKRQIEAEGGDIDRLIRKIKNQAIGLFGAFSAKEFIQEMAKVRGEFQQYEVAFETMLGSGAKASALMSQLINTAAKTPFGMTEVTNGAKQLLAYGTSADEVNDTLIRLGDIAAGLSIPLGDLVMLYGTTMTQGRMFTQDLRQFQGRGIPIVDELAKQFGVAKSKVGELVTAGKVGAAEFQQAIISMTSEGSKFGGLMEKQSKTITGQISNIQDAVEQMFNEIGKSNEGLISDGLGLVSLLVENWETVGKVLLTIVSTYGAYKAAVIAVGVAHKMAAIWGEVQAFLSLTKSITSAKDAMLLLNIATSANPVGLILGIVGATAASFALFSKNTDKATTMTEKFGVSAANAISKIDTLNSIIKGSSHNSELHHKAMDELNSVLQEYGIEALKESASIEDVNRKRQQAIQLIKEEAIERQRANALEQGQEDYVKSLKSAREQLLKDLANATTGSEILGLDFSTANNEIRDNASAISSIIGDIVENNISAIAGKTGDEYQKGIDRIYSEIQKRMRAIGLSEETIGAAWKDGGMIWVEDILGKYINKVQEAKEEHSRFTDAIEKSSEAEKSASEDAMSFEDKVSSMSKRLVGAGDDVHGLYKRIKDLMSQYSDNTIGFNIKFNAEIPKWMNTKELLELQRLAANFTALGNKASIAGVKIGDKIWTKQELLQRGADYAQAAENKQNEIDKRNKEKESSTKDNHKGPDDGKKRIENAKASHRKLLDLQKQQAEERLKQQQDYEYQQWQNRIDLMDEGEAKVIAQMELDHKKEQTSLEEQKNQTIKEEIARQKAIFDAQQDEKAAGNKKYAKQVFDPNSEEVLSATKAIAEKYATLEDELTQKHEKASQDRVKANVRAMDEYLSEYGTYQQKQLAIKQLYADKIKAANNEAERLTLAKERDNRLSEINVNNMLMDIDWSLMFEGVGNVLSSLAKETLDKIEAYMKTPEFKKLDASNKEAYTNARNKLREEVRVTGSGPFNAEIWGKVSEYTKKYQESIKVLRDANLQHTQAVSNLENANDNLIKAQNKLATATTDAEKTIAQKEVEIAQHGVNVAQTGVNTTAQNVTQAQDNASDAQDNLANSANDATAGLDNFQQILGQMTDGSLSGFANGIANLILTLQGGNEGVGQGLAGLGAALGGAGSKILGIVGAILSILDMLADDPEQRIHEITEKLYTAINKLLKQAFTLILSSIVDSVRLIANIGDGILKAFGIDVNWNNSNSKKVAETTEKLTERNERLQVSIDKLKESIDKSYGSQSIKDYQEARKAQQEYNDNLQKILDVQQRYHSAHHSNAYNWNISDESTALVNSLLGTNLSGDNWNDWSQLTAEQMDKIRTYLPQVWQEMLDSGDYDKSDYFNNYADQAGKLDELTKQIYENLTGISFEGLRDNFISSLMDMSKSAEDFGDDLTKILQESLLRANISDKFEKRIQDWYNSIAESMMDENGNYRELSDGEIDSYRQQWDQIVAEMIAERDRIAEITGYGIDAIQEKLTDISFDSVRDNFKSLLSDMESTTEDFANNFTDMLRNALIEGLMDSKYDTLLKEWYVAFAEAMDDQNLTDEERERLRQQYQAIVDQGIADRNAINDIVGGGAYSQQASKGEAWGMTQETGEELNGRFTALVELQAANNTLVGQGNSLAIGILATLQSIAATSNTVTGSGDNETLLSIRDMMFLSTGHLADIAKYTKSLNAIETGIGNVEQVLKDRL